MRKKNSTAAVESSAVCYDTLEQWARGKMQAQLQRLLEEEVTTFLGPSPARTPWHGVANRSTYREPKRLRHTPRLLADEWDGDGAAPVRPRSDGPL